MIWQCPHCKQPLELQAQSWRCASGHSFDRAKEGYVNLLPVQQKRSREPGDSADMLNARRRFLEAGCYEPLAEAICAQLSGNAVGQGRLLDVGCGEGYYTRRLAENGWTASGIAGIDIAKAGVRLAAKKQPDAHFAVASSYHLPVADDSVDAILRVFAPGPAEELLRVLKPGGLLLDVSPGPDHLWSLKGRLYESPQRHELPVSLSELLPGLEMVSELRCEFALDIDKNEQVRDFLSMTPFAWKGRPDARQQLEQQDTLTLEADFLLRSFRKVEQPAFGTEKTNTDSGQESGRESR
ncbi:23S rRNA (guanine(745)-N(1))-methyltransferase [Microbulbifer hydrolyticus]|uniref:23S rRNA (Guanine(745)-N(1))-methyltransferase n=1 Tax=Microbulbifer hydrolyticus TaxID=48074 RepID=A0A6P1TEQ1_9GAMM|nr:23S rRNA (guanine(745)-N(1))-methyltransferase [Microbulbifer hydrolyticus]MBB5212050.1 23S rRNA (guanine745-N1)-methyltransferase [Microbulbifer hydrolyticus]QHQ39729.1 23S rRNA (guanine(745)-N(1))-methyltransferase [Microbulbifer hydrolyticus]